MATPSRDEVLSFAAGFRRIIYCVAIAVIVLHPTVSTSALGHQTIKHATFTMLSRER